MVECVPNSTSAAQEKHVPVVMRGDSGLIVSVGAVAHPMEEQHFIGFIAVQDGAQVHVRSLSPGDVPRFTLPGVNADAAVVYAWCNLHGLWKA
jgi:superoxide reductase